MSTPSSARDPRVAKSGRMFAAGVDHHQVNAATARALQNVAAEASGAASGGKPPRQAARPRRFHGRRRLPATDARFDGHTAGRFGSVDATSIASADDSLVERLRAGDEAAFCELVGRHDSALRRMARRYVPDAVADDVVQETWLTVIRGLNRFEGRSSLKTWVFGILVNVARRRAQREGRTVPFATAGSGTDPWSGAVDPERLNHPELGRGYWPSAPTWARDPADVAQAREARDVVLRAIGRISDAQREVITLRDLEGWSGPEVCDVLGISDVNQRTLLHRARIAVRAALEEYFDG
jgi:RNA polymerase sigma-70 factor, ECF subfamily